MESPENEAAFFAINALPREVLGLILSWLEVAERLRGERVCRLWRSVGLELGWSEQTELSANTVFRGTTQAQQDAFNYEHLAGIIRRSASKLQKLNILSEFRQTQGPIQRVFEQIQLLPRLTTLVIFHNNNDLPFVRFLPATLRDLHFHCSSPLDDQSLAAALPGQCPNLDTIRLANPFPQQSVSGINNLLGAYSSTLKTVQFLLSFSQGETTETLIRIGSSFPVLEQLELINMGDETGHRWVSDDTVRGVVAGCRRLKRFGLSQHPDSLSEDALLELSALTDLCELRLDPLDGFTDAVLKAIARRKKLTELYICRAEGITDDSILYLTQNCKSLIEFHIGECPNVTDEAVTALVAEVNRHRQETGVGPLSEEPFEVGGILIFFESEQ